MTKLIMPFVGIVILWVFSYAALPSLESGSAFNGEAYAQATAKDAKEEENRNRPVKDGVIRPGVIASSGRHKGAYATDATSSTEAGGDTPLAVTGSIRRLNRAECSVVLSNSSKEESFSVSYAVEGVDPRGNKVLRRTYSATLKPGATKTNTLKCAPDLAMQVVLTSGKKVGK